MRKPTFLHNPLAVVCVLAFAWAAPLHGAVVSIDTSLVGDAGNNADSNGRGSVGYEFWMGTYEVSIGQYTAFLNTVATRSDTSYLTGLWSAQMSTDLTVRGITRAGTGSMADPYVYSEIGSADRPISYVSWFDAARFANWVNNGAASGASTETGAYNLNGATSGIFQKESDALWWIPSQDEWYKAAYYAGGSTDADYWLYPTQSNTIPSNTVGDTPNQANYFNGTYSEPGEGNKLTDGGAFTSSGGTYGTFDQGGNLSEWNDFSNGSERGIRGGAWNDGEGVLQSGFAGALDPSSDAYNVGFRLATSVPEPPSISLILAGLLGWLFWRSKTSSRVNVSRRN